MFFSGLVKFSFGPILASAVSFFTTPIVTLLISPENFGIASLFSTVSTFIYPLISLGTSSAFMRFFYEVDPEKRHDLLWNSLLPPVICFVAIFFILFQFRIQLVNVLFSINNERLIFLLFCDVFLKLVNRFAMLVIRMKKKGATYSLLVFFSSIINTAVIIIYSLKIAKNFNAVIIGSIVSQFIVTVLAIIIERQIWFNKNIKISINEIKKSLSYGAPLILSALFSLLFQTMDKYFLKAFHGFQQLGLYSVSFKIISVLNILQSGFSLYFTPIAFEKYEKNNEDKYLYERTYAQMLPLLVIMGLVIILFKDIITLILNKTYRESASIMPFLIFFPIMYMLTEVTSLGVYFKKKLIYETYIYIALSISSVIFNIIFVRLYGARGTAMVLSLNYILYFIARSLVSYRLYPLKINVLKTAIYLSLLWVIAFINTFFNNRLIEYCSALFAILFVLFMEREMLSKTFIIFFENIRKKCQQISIKKSS